LNAILIRVAHPADNLPVLLILTFLVALLYSSVGHGGASGYLAAMSLISMTQSSMKPTALVLNLLVAGVGSYRYISQGFFSWKSFWPFALGSIPFAFIGGGTTLSHEVYRRILGAALLIAAAGMLWRSRKDRKQRQAPIVAAAMVGVAIGFVSGLIGVGGGIFLSPLLILLGWATTRETLGIAALFIFVNSLAGLAGHLAGLSHLPPFSVYLAFAAVLGGLLGTQVGVKKFGIAEVRWALAGVLCIAAGKLIF
jgi:uncharacterized protein